MSGNDASLEEWRLSVRTLIIPYHLPISDMHLLYISQRLPGVECLSLLGSTRITIQGLETAVKNWKGLKVVQFGPVTYCNDEVVKLSMHDRFLEVLGRYCQGLEGLHIYGSGNTLNRLKCEFIAQNLPNLKKLVIEKPYSFRDGLAAMRQMCHNQLEEVEVILGSYVVAIEFSSTHALKTSIRKRVNI